MVVRNPTPNLEDNEGKDSEQNLSSDTQSFCKQVASTASAQVIND